MSSIREHASAADPPGKSQTSSSRHRVRVDQVRLGHSFRALRLNGRWRQSDVGAKAGVSASSVSRIERGRLGEVSVATLRKLAEALDASLEIRLRWNGEGLDRLLDQAHAGLVESLVVRLRNDGWVADVEASFAIRGERGSIDVLGYHEATGIVLVTEVKSVVPDSQATLSGVDRKARLAPDIARARGWICRGVARLLVVGDSTTSRRRIEALSATYRAAFPVVGRDVSRWLRQPDRPIAGLLFLPYARRVHGRKPTTGMQRVRRGRSVVTRPQATAGRAHGDNRRDGPR
jgi:transcriptional regulator with XRE-family HTH domain